MRLYKAFVTNAAPSSKKSNHKTIWVQEELNRGTGAKPKPATPPSSLPTSQLGSGMITVPDKGQECIVMEVAPGERHIIRYIPSRNTSQYGLLYPPKVEPGSVLLSSNGYHKSHLKLTKKGRVTIKSNLFSQLWVDGPDEKLFAKSKRVEIAYAGGHWKHFFKKEGKKTWDRQVWSEKMDNDGMSDWGKRTEEGYSVPLTPIVPPYEYVDKVIRKIGSIPGEQALYSLETRQSRDPLNLYDKNIVTKLRLGYQDTGSRFDKDYTGGNLIEWTGKKNITDDIASFIFRWGKLEDNTPNSEDKGEIFRMQALEGLNNGIPYGSPITDPLGEGEGYAYSKGGDSEQTYSLSFGLLEDETLLRERIAHEPLTGGPLWFKRTLGGEEEFFKEEILNEETDKTTSLKRALGGENTWKEEIEQDKALYTHQINQENQKISRKVADGELDVVFDAKETQINYKGENGTTNIILKGNEVIISEEDGAKLKIGGGMVGLGKGSVEVVDLIKKLADALVKTTSPGYGAPLPTLGDFSKISADAATILGGV